MSVSPTSLPTNRERIARFIKFGIVGGSGVVVNLSVFQLSYALLAGLDGRLAIASSLGIAVSIFTNFLLNDRWTWGDRVKGGESGAWLKRLLRYYMTCSIAGLAQLLTTWTVHTYLLDGQPWLFIFEHDLSPSVSALFGICAGIGINFPLSHLWTFKDEHPDETHTPTS